jgi:hypothetical protein
MAVQCSTVQHSAAQCSNRAPTVQTVLRVESGTCLHPHTHPHTFSHRRTFSHPRTLAPSHPVAYTFKTLTSPLTLTHSRTFAHPHTRWNCDQEMSPTRNTITPNLLDDVNDTEWAVRIVGDPRFLAIPDVLPHSKNLQASGGETDRPKNS